MLPALLSVKGVFIGWPEQMNATNNVNVKMDMQLCSADLSVYSSAVHHIRLPEKAQACLR